MMGVLASKKQRNKLGLSSNQVRYDTGLQSQRGCKRVNQIYYQKEINNDDNNNNSIKGYDSSYNIHSGKMTV